jgi:hypothetical protein
MKIKLIEKNILDHDLWKRDLYLQDIDYIIGANIYEYDMKNAGYNLSIKYELLDQATLDYLGTLTKEERTIRIGLLMRDHSVYRKSLTASFAKMRKRFFIDNEIAEHHVLSIKKDAIFLINKSCDQTKFGSVEFVLKNRYTSFHRFDNLEFYYRNTGKTLHVKGIKDENLPYHEEFMLTFLKDVFALLETSDNKTIVSKIKKFASMYKNRKLANGFYRELNPHSMYTLKLDSKDTTVQSMDYINGFEIRHSYNYMTFILRLIQRFFFINN